MPDEMEGRFLWMIDNIKHFIGKFFLQFFGVGMINGRVFAQICDT